MKNSNIKINHLLATMILSLVAFGGCTTYKDYVQKMYNYGKIVKITDKNVIISIGCKERVRIGQLVDAYKTIKVYPGFTRHYKRITMGIIEITDYEDDYNAKGKIILGTIDKECRVAL